MKAQLPSIINTEIRINATLNEESREFFVEFTLLCSYYVVPEPTWKRKLASERRQQAAPKEKDNRRELRPSGIF